jgi:hypothetical protein
MLIMSQANSPTLASSQKRHRSALWIAGLAVAAIFIFLVAQSRFRVARKHAVHSYVESVCNAVQNYYQEHDRYPQSLIDIDTSMLDYDLEIPLQDLDYEVFESSFRVSYRLSDGQVIECPCPLLGGSWLVVRRHAQKPPLAKNRCGTQVYHVLVSTASSVDAFAGGALPTRSRRSMCALRSESVPHRQKYGAEYWRSGKTRGK